MRRLLPKPGLTREWVPRMGFAITDSLETVMACLRVVRV